MRVDDDESGASIAILEEDDHADVVSRHDAVVDVVLTLHVGSRERDLREVDELLVKDHVSAILDKSGTPINLLNLLRTHRLRLASRPEHTLVPTPRERFSEEIVVVVTVHFLQAHNI